MPKKSARSRGFRKTAVKKPFLTKKEIVLLCIIAAAVIAVVILFATYDDGAMKVKDGAFVEGEPNWIIANCGTSNVNRYFKIAEAGEIEGYTMTEQTSITGSVEYTPADENSAVRSITVAATHSEPAEFAEYMTGLLEGVDGTELSEIRTAPYGDSEYTYFTYKLAYYVAPEEEAAEAETEAAAEDTEAAETEDAEAEEEAEPEPNTFSESIYAYVPTIKDCSIVIQIGTSAETADEYLSEEALVEVVEQTIAAITPETAK